MSSGFTVLNFCDLLNSYVMNEDINVTLQPAFICLKLTKEALDPGVLSIQSKQ